MKKQNFRTLIIGFIGRGKLIVNPRPVKSQIRNIAVSSQN